MKTGEKIKSIRQRLGLTQRDMGSIIGYTQPAIASWELCKRDPSLDAMQRIFFLAKDKRLPIKMGWFFGICS